MGTFGSRLPAPLPFGASSSRFASTTAPQVPMHNRWSCQAASCRCAPLAAAVADTSDCSSPRVTDRHRVLSGRYGRRREAA